MNMSAPLPTDATIYRMLSRAAMAAMRAAGDAEPNPLVGCVIARGEQVIGIGHHRKFGNLHAEREALADCARRGEDPRGTTMFCTLEPCCHHGKQPPCTEAAIDAGIARFIYARSDPGPESGGGAKILQQSGIDAHLSLVCPLATHLSDPFVHGVRTGKPWVIAKWAQTIDGRIATRTGESQWITGPLVRRRVHRLRARVDAVVVGVGTVLADNPSLTPRDVRRVRRTPTRVVFDTDARTPLNAKLVQSAAEIPTAIITCRGEHKFPSDVRTLVVGRSDQGIDAAEALAAIQTELGASVILVEAGPRVLGTLLDHDLIDEAFVHIAPMVLADAEAMPVARGREAPALTDARRFNLVHAKPLAGDIELHYRRKIKP
ncbi:MAG: bifunctional diaminohydroxyphosphoribosylaminopyrimidine deaminase/5-amino-6-(5-phosphoribosylamino)uracil reductase RibD [Phycisphaerales bacterium]